MDEKKYWIAQLSLQNEKTLQLWSEQLELLDEIKEKLLASTPFQFKNKLSHVLGKGISLFELGIYDNAIEELKKEMNETDNPSRLYLYLGYSSLYINREDEAKEAFLNVIHRSNDPLEKHFSFLGLGLQAGRAHRMEEAISYFEKAEALLFNPDVVYNLGICYLLLNMPKEAAPYFEKVVESGEDVAEAVYFLGKCYMDNGDRAMAMEIWYNAIHEFNNEALLLSLAIEFEEKGYFSCAIYCYERLENIGANHTIVLHGRSWNYGLMDEIEKAKEGFKELFEENPYDENAWISYLWLLRKWEDDDYIEAKEKVKQLGITHPLIDNYI